MIVIRLNTKDVTGLVRKESGKRKRYLTTMKKHESSLERIGMKGIILMSVMCVVAFTLAITSCSTIKYVPIETTRVAYKNHVDTLRQRDSIYIKEYMKGDTVYVTKEKFKYLYKVKIDTVAVHDSTQVPYPVEVTKEVTPSWCYKLVIFDVIALLILTLIFAIKKGWLHK